MAICCYPLVATGYVGHRRAGAGGNIIIINNNNNHTLATAIPLDFERNTTKQQNIRRKQTQKAGKWGRPRQKRDQEKNEETLA